MDQGISPALRDVRGAVEAFYTSPLPVVLGLLLIAGGAGLIATELAGLDLVAGGTPTGVFGAIYGTLLLWATRTTRERVRLRHQRTEPDPIPPGVLAIYYAAEKDLASVAVQRGVSPGPVKREQTRRWSLKGGAAKGIEVGGERGGESKETYDVPSDTSQLLRELTKSLSRADELVTHLGVIPSVDADKAFAQDVLEAILLDGFRANERGGDGPAEPPHGYEQLAAEAAEILADGLPQANLAAAKRGEFAKVEPGQFVLIESGWQLIETDDDGPCLELAELRPHDGLLEESRERRARVPATARLRVTLEGIELARVAQLRWRTGIADGGVFGTAAAREDDGTLLVVPLAIFSRAPKVTAD